MLTGEVFPSDVRGMASGAASSVGYIFGFLANKTHFSLVGGLTLAGTFYVYVCVSLTATVLFFIFMPETEGRTLLEISQHFAGQRYNLNFFFIEGILILCFQQITQLEAEKSQTQE